MNDSLEWRRSITIWIAALCVTAIICAWLARGYRYQSLRGLTFDKLTGYYYTQSGERYPKEE